LGRFFTQNMGGSLNFIGDTMPGDREFRTRIKHVHQQGLVAPIRWVAEAGQPYSGLFQGAELGFARISESGFMLPGATTSNPSAAIKLLRDEVPSGNLLFMDTFDGQESMDFFLPSLTTHPTPIRSETCRQTAQRKLSEASRFPFSVGSSDFASFDQDGNSTTELLFPYEVILEPTR